MAVKNQSQEEVNRETIKLMKTVISNIETGKVNVKDSVFAHYPDHDDSVLEVVLDGAITYK